VAARIAVLVMRRRRGHAAAGFTLLEMLVTLAVLGVGLALVSRLLVESQLGLARAQAELGNPLPRYALARLRVDVEQALDVPAILPGWRSSPLTLIVPGGGRVAWQRSGEELERVVLDAAGRPRIRHVVLREVADWRWRSTAPGLIDVELVYRARDTAGLPLADVVRTWSPPTIERSVWMRVGLRAEGATP
jgi:prepilin-type N-terminal cleavage/methylation domain-containing protein